MRRKEDWFLYTKLCILLGLVSFISFEGVVISSLAYILAYDIIRYDK